MNASSLGVATCASLNASFQKDTAGQPCLNSRLRYFEFDAAAEAERKRGAEHHLVSVSELCNWILIMQKCLKIRL